MDFWWESKKKTMYVVVEERGVGKKNKISLKPRDDDVTYCLPVNHLLSWDLYTNFSEDGLSTRFDDCRSGPKRGGSVPHHFRLETIPSIFR